MKKPTSKFIPVLALISAFLFVFNPASAQSKFQGEEWLKWDSISQTSFLQTSMMMAGAIASQARPDIAKCLADWYPPNEDVREQRHNEMINTVKEYPDYNPTAVVLWMVQNECGAYKQE